VSKKKKFNDKPFAYHQEIELSVTTLTNLGLGLGRVALEGRTTAQVGRHGGLRAPRRARPGAHLPQPRELLRGGPGRGARASPHRIEPRCPLFGRCGGCQYQNLRYEEQLEWKRRQVAELLEHMAGSRSRCRPSSARRGRSGTAQRSRPHFNAPREGGELAIGFLRQGTRFDIVDVPRCEIATEPINERLGGPRGDPAAGGRGRPERGHAPLPRRRGGSRPDHEDRVTEEVPLGPGGRSAWASSPATSSRTTRSSCRRSRRYVRDQARRAARGSSSTPTAEAASSRSPPPGPSSAWRASR
jgi:hypothetical protein